MDGRRIARLRVTPLPEPAPEPGTQPELTGGGTAEGAS